MADDCLTRLLDPEVHKKLFGDRKISKGVIEQFMKDIESIKVAADKDPSLGSYTSRANEYIRRKQLENQIDKNKAINTLRTAKIRFGEYTQPSMLNQPLEAVHAKISKSHGSLGVGLKDSGHSRGLSITESHLNFIYTELQKSGDWGIFQSGKIDLEIRQGVEALSKNRELPGISEEGKRIAQVLYDHNRHMLQEAHNSGIPTRDLLGFVATQTHNIKKIREVGFDQWRQHVESYGINKDVVFGIHAGDRDAELKILEQIYKGTALGNVGSEAPLTMAHIDDNIKMGVSYANKLSEARVLRFQDAEAEFKYNQEYGRSNLAESINYDVAKKGRMLGLVQIFGPNPEKAIQQDLLRLESFHRAQGNIDLARKIKDGTKRVMSHFEYVSGQSTIPGKNTLAKIGSFVRWVEIMSKLGYTGLKSTSNFATTAVKLKSLTGQNLLETSLNTMKEWAKTLPPGAKDRMMEAAGFFMRDVAMELSAHGVAREGFQAKAVKGLFKWTGAEAMTKGFRVSMANLLMHGYGKIENTLWKDLHPRVQAEVMGMGLGESDYNIMKRAVQEMPDGRRMLTPEGIEGLDLTSKDLKDRAAELKITPEKYRDELQYKYMGAITQAGSTASTTAGPRELSKLTMGYAAGTTEGEILRLVGQFKSYWIQDIAIGLELFRSRPDEQMLAKGILMSGKRDVTSVAQWMVGMTVLGYLSKAAKDMYGGKTPEDPRNVEAWFNAMSYGGAGGIYTDTLFGGSENFGMAENILGPTAGQFWGPGVKIMRGLKKDALHDNKYGQRVIDKTVKSEATKLVRNNIPFQQFPFVKQALDKLQYDVIQESLTPGYRMREELKQLKERYRGERL